MLRIGTQHFKSRARRLSPHFLSPEQLDSFLSSFPLHVCSAVGRSVVAPDYKHGLHLEKRCVKTSGKCVEG